MLHGLTEEPLRAWVRDQDPTLLCAVLESDDPRFEVVDLYGPLGKARRQAPVHETTQIALAGFADFRSVSSHAERHKVCVLGFDLAQDVLKRPEVFSNRIREETIGPVWGHTILGMDGEEHRRHRGLISKAFSSRAMDGWTETIVRPVVRGLLDRLEEDESVDLMPAFTVAFPVHVITAMLGLPPDDMPRFNRWATETIAIFFDKERGLAASRALHDYLAPIVEDRRARPGTNDLISLLVQAEIDGERLDTDAIVSFLRLLLPAGAETTFRSSSSTLFGLLRDPRQLEAVVHDAALLPAAIEEGIRWEPPLSSVERLAEVDTELAGVPVPADTIVEVGIGAANRDEAHWPDGDTFDLFREPRPHLSFAWGSHLCLGAHLARLETRVAFEELFARFPGMHLDPDREADPFVRGIGFRSPNALPVRLTRRGHDHE